MAKKDEGNHSSTALKEEVYFSTESDSKQPTQLIVKLNSSLRHIIVTQQHFVKLLNIGVTSLKMIKNCKFVDKVSKEQSGEFKYC